MKGMERKFYPTELKSADQETLTVVAVVSTEREDRQHDIMRSRGMETDTDKIPVLFSHGYGPRGNEPCGKINRLWIGSWKNYPAVFGEVQFYPDEEGERLYRKIVAGYLGSWSIGYTVKEYTPLREGGRDVTSWVLYEVSAVSVPANADTATIIESGKFQGVQCKFMNSTDHSISDRSGLKRSQILIGTPYMKNGRMVVEADDSFINAMNEMGRRVISEAMKSFRSTLAKYRGKVE